MAYIKDTANQEETGEGWKGRTDRWRVQEEQDASFDWVNWHDIPGMKEKGGRNIPARQLSWEKLEWHRPLNAAMLKRSFAFLSKTWWQQINVVTPLDHGAKLQSAWLWHCRMMFRDLFWRAWNRWSDCAWKVLLEEENVHWGSQECHCRLVL